MLSVEGSSLFRHHIVCSLLSKKPITISRIHHDEDPPGIKADEANFLKFIDRITSGSKIEARNFNQELIFSPGMILGGTLSHEVPAHRCVTYIAEAALMLLPFAKLNTELTLLGATQSEDDLCVDTLRTVTTRWLQLFGVDCSIRVVRRGCAPAGGGCIVLSVSAVRKLKCANIIERGKVKRVRGIAFATKTAPDLPQRAATGAKGVLLNVLPDVYVVTDVDAGKGRKEGVSGYGVMLVAETTSKLAVVSQESVARPREAPEDVGARAAALLLDQVMEGGCVDAHHQLMVLLLMGLAPDDVSVVRVGRVSSSGVSALSLLELFFSVTCAVKEEPSMHDGMPNTVVVTCIGSNVVNVWKKSS